MKFCLIFRIMKADYIKDRKDSIDGRDAIVDEVLKALKR